MNKRGGGVCVKVARYICMLPYYCLIVDNAMAEHTETSIPLSKCALPPGNVKFDFFNRNLHCKVFQKVWKKCK